MRLFVSGIHRKADREKPHLTINQSVLTPKSWTVKHEAYRSDSDIQLESDLLISGNGANLLI
ncbi:TPA: hypothetical protein HL387_18005 [Escherichia coli]|nr:hypothetical protein [Escherichia coli]TFL43849.1 hypothetical protein ELY29_12130 [Escherichia coli]TFL80495.1 hypothetical protein ELY23_07605 [Escherichia coli]TFN15433.1 hypothetical protein ELX80_20565 [Escherichia coli]TFO70477.1 hypothetical protein ELV14_21995 [Escherichia coli]